MRARVAPELRVVVASFVVSFVASLIALPPTRLAAQAPPSTDIYLAPLTDRAGLPVVGAPVNVTARPGYDNQPSFTPDGRRMLFTSVRGDGQADIYAYDLAAERTTRLTATPESEYSATVMPGGTRMSVIRVERDSAQRLWSFALDGSDPRLVVAALKPVGYHAWADSTTVAFFVLGRPNALAVAHLSDGRVDTVARNIGRSLANLPRHSGISFAQITDSATVLRGLDPSTGRSWDIARLPKGAQDVAWLANGTLLATSGSILSAWTPRDQAWHTVADLARYGMTDATRLAVSPDQRWLAIVAIPER